MLNRTRTLYLVLGALVGVMLLPHLLLPLNSDNDTYHAMAFAMEQGKGLPYLGSWDQNFPGIVFYHWFSIKLFGLSDLGFRIIDVLNHVAIALLCYAIASRFIDKRVALLIVPLVCLHYLSSGFWNAGQRDGFALTWLLVALYQLTKPFVSMREIVLASGSIALATFIRPTNAAFLLLLLPWLRKGDRKLSTFTAASATFTGILVILLLPWLLQEQGLREFYYAAVRFNLDVYGGERDTFRNFIDSLGVHRWFYLLVLVRVVLVFARKEERNERLLFGYGFIALCVILIMGKYHIYHFELLLPFTLISCVSIVEWLGQKIKHPVATAIIAFLAACYFFFPINLVAQFIKHGANEESLNRIYRNTASFPGFGLSVEESVIDHISRSGQLGHTEFLLLWPGLRWRSEQSGLTRFTTTYALTMGADKGLTAYQQQWREEVDSILVSRSPSRIVAATGPEYLFKFSKISPDSLLHELPQVSAMLSRAYSLDTTIGGYRIYRKHDTRNHDTTL